MFNNDLWKKVDDRNKRIRWDWPVFWFSVLKRSYSDGMIGWWLVIAIALNVIVTFTVTTIVFLLVRDFLVPNVWYARLIILVGAYLNGLMLGRMSVRSEAAYLWKLFLLSGALSALWVNGVYGLINTLLGIA